MGRWWLFPVMLLAFALGCEEPGNTGSSGQIPPPPLDVAGTWNGTWIADGGGGNGTIQLVMTQSKANPTAIARASGTGSMTTQAGPSCFTSGSLEADVGVTSLEGTLIRIPPPRSFPPPPEPCPPTVVANPNPNYSCEFTRFPTLLIGDLSVIGRRMTGTYRISNHWDLLCEGATGTIEATR